MKTHVQLDLRTDSGGETKSRSVGRKRPGASLLLGAAPGTGVSQQIRLTDESALVEDCQPGSRLFQIRRYARRLALKREMIDLIPTPRIRLETFWKEFAGKSLNDAVAAVKSVKPTE